MDRTEQFYDAVKRDMTMILATACGESVTMRDVAPVYYDGKVLFFTDGCSLKYSQLRVNPHCCIAVGGCFAECSAEFCGSTMLDENSTLRSVYSEKFPGAFDEGVEYGGRDSEFILLSPSKLRGWAFIDDVPTADGVPNLPFEIDLH